MNKYLESRSSDGRPRVSSQASPPDYAVTHEPVMNATLKMLKTRRSAPPATLRGPGPDAAQLETLLTIASRVPDHGKLAPWRFIVFEGDGRARAGEVLARAFLAANPDADEKRLSLERTRLSLAPLVVAVISRAGPHVKIPEWEQQLSAGAACMNLIAAATAMGYAACWLTDWFAYDRAALEGLGVAPNERPAGFIHIGRNDEPREDRVRPALADIVTRF